MTMHPFGVICWVALLTLGGWASLAAGVELRLTAHDQALHKVVVAEQASERIRAAATTLAKALQRMTGIEFQIVSGDGARGLAVGLPADFPPTQDAPLDPRLITGREDYLLRTHAEGAYLVGATDLAVEHAVWDFLHRLGQRQYFPGAHWEIVPRLQTVRMDVDVMARPAFHQRTFASGHGYTTPAQRDAYERWSAINRATAGLVVQAGHAYGAIISANQAEFDRHPEYLSLVDGQRVPKQFCLSNPGLRKLVGEHALRYFQKYPDRDCISLEPNDGGNHCECDECRQAGSVSNRVVALANHVATVANAANIGARYVGLLAYSRHAEPPTIDVHSRVVVRISFYGESTSQHDMDIRLPRMAAWQEQGATVGVSEYLNTFVWDHALPARAKGSNLQYLKTMLPKIHAHGARYFHCSHGDGWGPTGLGSYIATRILWDLSEADQVERIVAEFLRNCFAGGATPMSEFYRLIDAGNVALLSEDLVGRLYRALGEARRLTTGEPEVQPRLDDLVLYVRYVELHRLYDIASNTDRAQRYIDLMRHSHRMRRTSMAHYRGALGNIPRKFPGGNPPAAETWHSEEPFSPEELAGFVAVGTASNRLLEFTPVTFSTDLAPAAPLNLKTPKEGVLDGYAPHARNLIYTWLEQHGEFRVQVSGHGGRTGRMLTEHQLFAAEAVVDEPVDRFVGVLEKDHDRIVTFKSPHRGLHWIESYGPSLRLKFLDGQLITAPCGMQAPFSYPNWSLYFYVPPGTKSVGGFAEVADGRIRDGDGAEVFSFKTLAGPSYFDVPVAPGQDGKLWYFEKCRGRRILMTVPPYLARSEKELLLPREVIERALLKPKDEGRR